MSDSAPFGQQPLEQCPLLLPAELIQRYRVVELSEDRSGIEEFRLTTSAGVQASIRRVRGELWELVYSSGPNASELTRKFVLGAQAHQWVVIELWGRIFQQVMETEFMKMLQTVVMVPAPISEVLGSPWSLSVRMDEQHVFTFDNQPVITHVLETP